jgi:protein O-GlcNAc transferase
MRVGRVVVLTGLSLMAGASVHARAQSAANTDALKEADAAFREGYAARQNGDLAQARAKFAEVVKLAPGIPEAHEALGAVLLEMGKPTDAIAELEAAAKLKPGDSDNQANLAIAYAQAGQWANALEHFESAKRATRDQQQSAAFYDGYAHALAATGKADAAVDEFDAEETVSGPSAEVEDSIGTIYAQQGKWDDARRHFEQSIALKDSYMPARIHLGVLLREQKDLPGSLTALEQAAKIDPPNGIALYEYGRTFELALKADPGLMGAQLELAMALQRLGRQQEAIPWFEKVIAQDPHNRSALTNLGLALTLTGRAKEGLNYFQRALAEGENSAVVYKDLGVAHVQLSAFDEAIEDFKKALTIDPNDPQLHYDLGLAYKFKDRMNEAAAELTRASELDPTLQDPPYTLGILYMQMGKLDDAVTELKKAVELRPENGDAWAILGSTLKQDSRLPEAAEALKKAIALQPGQPGPRVTLAGVLAEEAGNLATQADAAEAAGDATKAADLRGQMKDLRGQAAELRREGAELSRNAVNRQKANFALNAGNQLMMHGQIADAIARYQESIAADPTFADPHSQLAIAYERQGRPADAAAERAKATELAGAR